MADSNLFCKLFKEKANRIKKPKPTKLTVDKFMNFWEFYHNITKMHKTGIEASKLIWNTMPTESHKKAFKYVKMESGKRLSCNEYLNFINKY